MRKFKCIKSYESGEWLTKGKIYTEDNGRFEYDDGWIEETFDYDVGHFEDGSKTSDYLEEIFANQTSTLDNDTMIEKLKKHCSISSCEDCVLCDEWCEFEDPDTDELEYLYNLAFGNDQSNLANNSESTPKYDLKKDKIAVLCDTDKKLTELYKLFNSKPNTSVALVCNPSKLYVSWDSESNELTWDSVEYHEINHYTLLTFEEFMNGFVAKNPITFTITTSDTTTTLTDGTHTTSINRYYTDKHDDMVALEEVVKKYKSEMEDINKANKEPKVGDKVKVVDDGKVYSMYINWLITNNVSLESAIKWQCGKFPNNEEKYIIKEIYPHTEFKKNVLALIEDEYNAYIINIEGLEVVK